MRIHQCQVERREVQIGVSNSDEHCLVDSRVVRINLVRRLPRPTLVGSSDLKWSSGCVVYAGFRLGEVGNAWVGDAEVDDFVLGGVVGREPGNR